MNTNKTTKSRIAIEIITHSDATAFGRKQYVQSILELQKELETDFLVTNNIHYKPACGSCYDLFVNLLSDLSWSDLAKDLLITTPITLLIKKIVNHIGAFNLQFGTDVRINELTVKFKDGLVIKIFGLTPERDDLIEKISIKLNEVIEWLIEEKNLTIIEAIYIPVISVSGKFIKPSPPMYFDSENDYLKYWLIEEVKFMQMPYIIDAEKLEMTDFLLEKYY